MSRMEFVREWVWMQLADPQAAFAMLLLGGFGLVWECAAPGWIVPGVAGLVLATLAAATLPKLASAWILLLIGAVLIGLAARAGKPWLGIPWGTVLFATAGQRWNVPLPTASAFSLPFAIFAGLIWRMSYKAVANKRDY